MREQIVSTRPDHHGHQVVDVVVDRGYHPDTIHARTGVPIRLIFHREDDDACFERVVFSSPRMDRHLSASDVTIVDLPGQAPGEVRFTCGMGRFRGRIEVIDGGTDSVIAAIRRQVGRGDTPRHGLRPMALQPPVDAAGGRGTGCQGGPVGGRRSAGPLSDGLPVGVPVGRSRPRWLVPGLLVVIAGAGLVLAGVISFSTAVSAGLIGGMLLMHLGGHGGHGAHSGGQSDTREPVEETGKSARPGGSH